VLQQAITCRQDVIPDTPASTTPFQTYTASSHTHTESDIDNLGTAITLNADTSLVGNAWFLDTDTLSEDDAEKVPSQQSVKAYVDTQIAGLGSSMEFLGSYDANTTDPTDGDVGGTYVVTVAGTGVSSFWSTALEIGDVIIQENDPATTEADWVVVSRDIIPASETVAGVVELATQAEVNAGTDTARAITPDTLSNYSGFPTGTPEGTAILSTGETVGKLLQADGDNSCSWVAAPSGTPEGTAILSTAETVGKLLQADGDNTCSWVAAPSGTPEGTAILSTGETGGTKYLREDGDGTCSWQTVAGGGLSNIVEDTTPELGGELDCGANSIGFTLQTGTNTGGATAIDWGLGHIYSLTLAGSGSMTFTAPANPGMFILKIKQDATGSRTTSWPYIKFAGGGTAPTLSTGANQEDIFHILYDGTTYYVTQFGLNYTTEY